jgi:hypothetical protein
MGDAGVDITPVDGQWTYLVSDQVRERFPRIPWMGAEVGISFFQPEMWCQPAPKGGQMIEPQAVESTIYGLKTALQESETEELFRNGYIAFLLDRDGLTLVQRGPDRPPWPPFVTEVSPN